MKHWQISGQPAIEALADKRPFWFDYIDAKEKRMNSQ